MKTSFPPAPVVPFDTTLKNLSVAPANPPERTAGWIGLELPLVQFCVVPFWKLSTWLAAIA